MTRTGPQKYPGASQTYFYQNRYPGDAMESNVGVLHTTEGTTLPDYDGGASAPNFTALPDFAGKRLKWYQHFDFDTSARALVNRYGGVETNTANAVQIELVGTCDPARRTSWGTRRAGVDYLYWPDAPDWALMGLAEFVKWSRDNHGVKAQSTVKWNSYPGSYGATDDRLTGAEWDRYYGWLGHQHVPENDHGDPGNLNFARVLELMNPTPTTGTSMTAPNLSALSRDEDVNLVENVPYRIYWTGEHTDEGNEHGAGGKTVLDGGKYVATLNLRFLGLGDNETVDVYPVEEDATGTFAGQGETHEFEGRGNPALPVQGNVTITGRVYNRLSFEIVSRTNASVTLTEATLSMVSWPA